MKNALAKIAALLGSLVTRLYEVTIYVGGQARKVMEVVTEVVPVAASSIGSAAHAVVVAPINALGAIGRALTSKPQPEAQQASAAQDAARDEKAAVAQRMTANALEAVRIVARAHGGQEQVPLEDLKRAERTLDPAITSEIRKMRPLDAHQLSVRNTKNLHAFLNEFVASPAPSGNVLAVPARNHRTGARASAYKPGSKLDAEATAAAAPRLWAQDANPASGLSPAQRKAALLACGRFVEKGDGIRAGIHDFEHFVTHVQSKAAARNPQGPVRTPDDDLARRFA